jgi:hypothetical protein
MKNKMGEKVQNINVMTQTYSSGSQNTKAVEHAMES